MSGRGPNMPDRCIQSPDLGGLAAERGRGGVQIAFADAVQGLVSKTRSPGSNAPTSQRSE